MEHCRDHDFSARASAFKISLRELSAKSIENPQHNLLLRGIIYLFPLQIVHAGAYSARTFRARRTEAFSTVPDTGIIRDRATRQLGGFDGDLLFRLLRLCTLGQSYRQEALFKARFNFVSIDAFGHSDGALK